MGSNQGKSTFNQSESTSARTCHGARVLGEQSTKYELKSALKGRSLRREYDVKSSKEVVRSYAKSKSYLDLHYSICFCSPGMSNTITIQCVGLPEPTVFEYFLQRSSMKIGHV